MARKITQADKNLPFIGGSAAERVLRELMLMPGVLIVFTDYRFELTGANDYFYQYFKCDEASVHGKAMHNFLGDDRYDDMNEGHIKRVLSEGRVFGYDARTVRPDGESVTIRWSQAAFRDESQKLSIVSVGLELPGTPVSLASAGTGNNEADYQVSPDEGISVKKVITKKTEKLYKAESILRAGKSGADPQAESAFEFEVTGDEIVQAVNEKWFKLLYQPIIHGRTKKIVGAEGLLRMYHPKRGALLPYTFLPVAERSGLDGLVDNYVINAACKKLKYWSAIGLDLFISINLTPKQFTDPSFPEVLLSAVTKNDVAAGRLMIELTEDAVSREPEKAGGILKLLRGMGCRVCLDDFGTGFMSIRYMENLEIDNIKIDRSFLMDTYNNYKFYSIIEGVITLAHGLNLTVTAEGVETQPQLDFLRDKSCDYLQGYLLSRPIPEKDLDHLLTTDPDYYVRSI